ncbi:MAG: hypothetical protein GY863_04550 [bacterium]|nr:hypothetical protein [bacterium]
MKKVINGSVVFLIITALIMLSTAAFAQEKKADDAEKKYAPIVGEYEFDLTDLGMENQIAEFLIDSDALWIDTGDGEPGELEPVEDKEFEFTLEDPDQGTFIFKFIKDEEGKYNQVNCTIEMMGVEVIGTRIDDGK